MISSRAWLPQTGGTVALVEIFVIPVQSENASWPIVSTLLPNEKDSRPEHPENAHFPIDFTPFAKVTDVRLTQSSNALSAILVKLLGVVNKSSFSQEANAEAKEILEEHSITVSIAEDGDIALDKIKNSKPGDFDLVLMDITMPEMDGIQALKKIKESDGSASVIMCSAMGQQAMVIESIQAGAKDFIVKPFQADRVLEAVKKVVG